MEEQGMGGTLIDPLIKSIWSLSGMVILSVGMIVIALAASIYPTRRVLKIQPSEAMRIY